MRLLVNSFKYQLGYDILNECKNRSVEVEENLISTGSFLAKVQKYNNDRMSKEMLDKNRFDRLLTWQDSLVRYLKLINYNN